MPKVMQLLVVTGVMSHSILGWRSFTRDPLLLANLLAACSGFTRHWSLAPYQVAPDRPVI